jgi:biopolymer transport protein TolR
MAEINVVPYIDVMLVLLVIFMMTAPLLNQGVVVSLPEVDSDPLPQNTPEPVVVTINSNGDYFLNMGEKQKQSIDADNLVNRVAAVLKFQPNTPVLIRGDKEVAYGKVVVAMALLKKSGVESVGLMTDPLK